jgi:hypothetical protein
MRAYILFSLAVVCLAQLALAAPSADAKTGECFSIK